MNEKSKRIASIQDAMHQYILADSLVALQQLSAINARRLPSWDTCSMDEDKLQALIYDLRVAYSEVQKVRESLFRELLLTYMGNQESDVSPTRGPSTAFITKGS